MSKFTKINKWYIAQKRETECWDLIKDKIFSVEYQLAKKKYWESVIEKIRKYIKGNRILDIGCGPTGIFISPFFTNTDKYLKTGIDSLMAHYLENYPFLKEMKVNWINAPFENYAFEESFDTVFIFNALDHTQNPELVIQKINHILTPNGVVVISLNIYNQKLIKMVIEKIPFLDPLHPHKFYYEDLVTLLHKNGFKLIHTEKIDNLRIELEKATSSIDFVTHKKIQRNFKDFLFGVLRKIFFKTLEIIGYPVLAPSVHAKSILSEYLMIFRKIEN